MSLKGRWRMLGSDRQHAGWRAVEPGADPGVFGSQPGGSVRWKTAWGGVRVDHTNPATAALPGTGKAVRGLLLRYVAKMTGLSRSQVTRLVARYVEHSQ